VTAILQNMSCCSVSHTNRQKTGWLLDACYGDVRRIDIKANGMHCIHHPGFNEIFIFPTHHLYGGESRGLFPQIHAFGILNRLLKNKGTRYLLTIQ
jgi:hypothetical protein